MRLGSDDYVTKPFSIEELVERVRAVLRRAGGGGPGERRLSYADLELDEDTRDVWRNGRLIDLTPTEFKLLHYLLTNARRVLTREQILEHVWEYTFAGNASVLETYISYLRHKIDDTDPPLIHTVRRAWATACASRPITDDRGSRPSPVFRRRQGAGTASGGGQDEKQPPMAAPHPASPPRPAPLRDERRTSINRQKPLHSSRSSPSVRRGGGTHRIRDWRSRFPCGRRPWPERPFPR